MEYEVEILERVTERILRLLALRVIVKYGKYEENIECWGVGEEEMEINPIDDFIMDYFGGKLK